MPDFSLLLGLTPKSTFELVNAYLGDKKALLDLLQNGSICIDTRLERNSSVTLVLCIDDADPRQRAKNRAMQSAVEVFLELYQNISGQPLPQMSSSNPLPDENLQPLLGVLPSLLVSQFQNRAQLESTQDGTERDFPLIRDEKMLVTVNLDDVRSVEMFRTLQLYSTRPQVGLAERADGTMEQYHLFHFKTDDKADFSAIWRSGQFEDVDGALLDCYNDVETQSYVYLPDTIVPHRSLLTGFCRILNQISALLGETQTDRLAAVVPHKPLPFMLRLGRITFTTDYDLTPRIRHLTTYNIPPLQDGEHMLNDLRSLLQTQANDIGFETELRLTHYQDYHEAEYHRLMIQVEQIDNRLRELETLANQRPRPRLFCFNQRQLIHLADVLRKYPLEHTEKLLYAFCATHSLGQEGRHYLYIDGSIELDPLDPLLWWDSANGSPPLEFWVDPFWSHHYYAAAKCSEIFVPRGTRLYPPLETWKPEAIDSFLAHAFNVPEGNPKSAPFWLYIFDEVPNREERVGLTILDKNTFAPVTTPDILTWLNKNILVMAKNDRPQEVIEKLADAQLREQFLMDIVNEANTAEAEFTNRAGQIVDTYGKESEKLVKHLNSELGKLITGTEKLAQDAAELNQKIQPLQALYVVLNNLVDQIDTLTEEADTEQKELKKDYVNVAAAVETTIADAETARRDAELKIDSAMQELEQSTEKLLARVGRLQTLLSLSPAQAYRRAQS